MFHGWVRGRIVRVIGPVVGLRKRSDSGVVPRRGTPQNDDRAKDTSEKFVYVGCVHGGNEEIYKEIDKISKSDAEYVIFMGDITGSSEVEKLKKRFYDTREKGDKELNKFEYFGNWAATLPKEKREELLISIKNSTERLIRLLGKIKEAGKKVFILEGNWDNPQISGMRAITGLDLLIPFSTHALLKNVGIKIIDTIYTVETKETLHIFLPYFVLLHWGEQDFVLQGETLHRVEKARHVGKTIILVAHAEANWKVHHLHLRNPHAGGERRHVIHNFGKAIAYFHPDEVMYPHQHTRIHDGGGTLIPLDEQYILHITPDGNVVLKDDAQKMLKSDILIQYVPFGYAIEEEYK